MAKKTIIGEDGQEYTVKTKKPIYKRVWFWILVIAFIGLIGKNVEVTDGESSSQKATSASGDATEAPETETPAFKIGDTITTDKAELTILDVDALPEVPYGDYLKYSPDSENNVYYVLHVRVKNIDKQAISVDSTGFALYDDDIRYSPSTMILDDALTMERINPGTEIERRVFYDVPAEVSESNNLRVKITSGLFSSTGKSVEIELN